MGCCVSSGKSTNSTHKLDRNSTAAAVKNNENREPPSVTEEETVKEVLTETTALKPPPPPPPPIPPEKDAAVKNEGNDIEKKFNEIPIDGIVQQPSEFYEISKSNEFLATANFIDIIDGGGGGGGEVHQKALKSSPVKLPKTQLIVGSPNKTLNRRSEPSPVRRNRAVGAAGFVQNRDVSPAMARRGLRPELPRRDPDENPGRRSRSPAAARLEGERSRSALRPAAPAPSVRKLGKSSPLRAATATAPAAGQKRVEENNIIDENCNTQIESLENPLVSLECFIFL